MTFRTVDRSVGDSGLSVVRWQATGYRGSENLILLSRPDLAVAGAYPMFYAHGLLGDAAIATRWPAVRNLRRVADAGIPVIVADFGGFATWANDDVVEAGNAIDDAIEYAAAQFGTRTDKVIAAGESMGSWAAAAWSWRNVGRVAGVWLLAPIVDALSFFNANPSMQASINAAYGGNPGFLAARATHDPILNVAAMQPLAPGIRLDLGASDPLIAPSIPVAWAAAVGVPAENVHIHIGGHDAPYRAVDGPGLAEWAASRVRLHRYL